MSAAALSKAQVKRYQPEAVAVYVVFFWVVPDVPLLDAISCERSECFTETVRFLLHVCRRQTLHHRVGDGTRGIIAVQQ